MRRFATARLVRSRQRKALGGGRDSPESIAPTVAEAPDEVMIHP